MLVARYLARMTNGQIYLVREQGKLVALSEQAYDSEAVLQELLAQHPALLAGEQLVDGDPRRWLFVDREMPVSADTSASSWYVDHLFLDHEGIPTLIEVKRSSDTRIRREVVGQMLDYAASAVDRWPVQSLRERFSDEVSKQRLEFFLEGADSETYWQSVAANLEAGRIRMIFVADEIPPELRKVVDFLARQFRSAEVFAVEVRQFQGSGEQALVPRLVSMPKSTVSTALARKQWDEASFFTELALKSPDGVPVARRIYEWAKKGAPDIWFGNGATLGSCFPGVNLSSGRVLPFAMWTYGVIEMQFQHMKVAPLDQLDVRRELVARLNAIPGLVVPPDGITRRPSFPLSVLEKPESLQAFLRAMDWAVDLAKSHQPA
jgi:hypothetical protein